jgi:NADH-quinone oxidoreductase subunit G
VLPAGSFAETDGTLVNNEGRAQRSFQVFPAEGIRESWRWLQQVAAAAGVEGLGDTLDALTAACAQLPNLAGVENAAPNAKFRMAGAKIPRMPHRYSGRTAMNAKKDVHEPRPAQDKDSPLAFSMEGNTGLAPEPAALIPMVWYPSWNSPQAVNKFQDEIGGHLKGGDPGVHLFKPNMGGTPKWFNPPAASTALETVALHEFYGSEELSAQSPAVGSRIPPAYIAVSPATAAKEKLKDGERATVQLNGASATLAVRVREDFAANAVGVPVGLADVPTVTPGAPARFGGKA